MWFSLSLSVFRFTELESINLSFTNLGKFLLIISSDYFSVSIFSSFPSGTQITSFDFIPEDRSKHLSVFFFLLFVYKSRGANASAGVLLGPSNQ